MKYEKIKHVVVSGGTHGNEYTGAFLARHWTKNPEALQRSTFRTHAIFANPRAFDICRRYVDRDLNRSFHPSVVPDNSNAYELSRAQEIERNLLSSCDGNRPDVLFDLHSTTANMGRSLVLTNREPFNLLLYAYLRRQFPDVCAYLWEEPNSKPGFLNSLSKLGFAIEVGSVANGVLCAEWVIKTSELVQACLDFIDLWNQHDKQIPFVGHIPLYCFREHIDYPRADDGLPAAMIHPQFQGKDFQPLKPGEPVFLDFQGQTQSWEGKTTWPVFINEAAYYEKGIAFTTTECIDTNIQDIYSRLTR